ncbi:uncharacterized protein PADG_00309 [Paracoccidioides brasiliensis Pb18]|uniref:Uncharacterized protein n=1 Tax=Paracoccidioides brasiliensis (strain Pb18) TaxID=502780 RepID=C1G0B9_PARBD|nr:uncharacterized protein PADG_00309 [Paracoccidioides brasiliensis Pb18]EEH44020.2 hypothetical protein PADG_00309 [Paracoccidioides brasiliensis Pb18]
MSGVNIVVESHQIQGLHLPSPRAQRSHVPITYLRIMAVYLFPAASQAKLPIEAPDSDYNSNPKRLRAFIRNASMVLLESYENGVKYLCEIGMQWYSPSTQEWLKPTAILKQIQLPDFWEAERQYLESPGCLAKRCLIELQTLSGNGQLHYASPVSAIQIVPQASRPGQITEDNPIAFLDISNRRPCRTRVAGKRRPISYDKTKTEPMFYQSTGNSDQATALQSLGFPRKNPKQIANPKSRNRSVLQ